MLNSVKGSSCLNVRRDRTKAGERELTSATFHGETGVLSGDDPTALKVQARQLSRRSRNFHASIAVMYETTPNCKGAGALSGFKPFASAPYRACPRKQIEKQKGNLRRLLDSFLRPAT